MTCTNDNNNIRSHQCVHTTRLMVLPHTHFSYCILIHTPLQYVQPFTYVYVRMRIYIYTCVHGKVYIVTLRIGLEQQ